MKILNLYAGIGGNRKLWTDCDVVAVELNPKIANIYKSYFPDDSVLVQDAHDYLIKHYKEFDFIWASPPCQSHSDIRRMATQKGSYEPVYPDMKLYQEIIFLKHFATCKFVIENVRPYYEPLIMPDAIIDRHYFWSNFIISNKRIAEKAIIRDVSSSSEVYGFSLAECELEHRKDQILRNCVNPKIGLHILKCAINGGQTQLSLNLPSAPLQEI